MLKLTVMRMFADFKAEAENLSRSGDILLATTNRQMLVIHEVIEELIRETGLQVEDDRTPEHIKADERVAAEAAAKPQAQPQAGVGMTQADLSNMMAQAVASAVAQAIAQLKGAAAPAPSPAPAPAPAPIVFPPAV